MSRRQPSSTFATMLRGWTMWLFICCARLPGIAANPDAKRLYDDLLSTYNRLILPVSNNTETVTVKMGLRLSQLLDLNLKDQILTTNVWVDHEWRDYKFMWNPDEYGGVTELYVPSEHIWLPDIVVYNNADGEYVITTMTKAILYYDGRVSWSPPAIFKTYCEIDVRYFPFDKQECFMKFGSWTYDGFQVVLKHMSQAEPGNPEGSNSVDIGIDLREFYPSVEWDILSVPARQNVRIYPCCPEPYYDIYFNITLRRKTLFYTVNLIIPSVGLSYLSILVFYLPADSGEKIVLIISVLLSQTMFFLLISEIIPPTSLAVPLLGRYLLFTMFMVGASVLLTILVLNVHYRKPSTHRMAPWVRQFFIHMFPKALCMNTPDELKEGSPKKKKKRKKNSQERRRAVDQVDRHTEQCRARALDHDSIWADIPPPPPPPGSRPPGPAAMIDHPDPLDIFTSLDYQDLHRYPPQIERAVVNVRFIQHHLQAEDALNSEDQDWGFVAMVLDRFFLYIFIAVTTIGTFGILLDSPSLYDFTTPIDMQISMVAQQLMQNEQSDV